MADPLEQDADYIEACRVAAWTHDDSRDRYWDARAGRFRWPTGWPKGVEPESYVRRQIAAVAPPVAPLPAPSPTGPLSPSVRRLRGMLK